jgi:hypothetical protein
MATIHVARDGAKLGEFSLEQIREGLRTGQFRATDLGWQSGMTDWRPLGEFAVETPSATPTPSAAAPSSSAISPVPATTAAIEEGLPWEHRQQLGFFKAFFDTVSVLLMKPGEAFTMMKREGGMTDPLLFAVIGGSIGTIASILFQIGLQSILGIGGSNNFVEMLGVGMVIGLLVLTPLLMAAGMFIGAAILHLCLMILGCAKRGFETTFRVVCFSCGAAYLFSIIPFCGGYITPIYNIVLQCIGLTRAQETTTGQALLAIFMPLIACCGIVVLVMVLVGVGSGGDFLKLLRP